MASFYRRFVLDFAKVARPLYELTKENVRFEWQKAHEDAFELLKKRLTTFPVLRYPDFSRPFSIYTDASRYGLGAVLSQTSDDGKEHPVAYASRNLNPAESRYPATELEGLAVYWAVKLFRPYVYGKKFRVVTDHLPLA